MNQLDNRLHRSFHPRSIAVVGATEDPNKVGGRPLHYLRECGFQGAVYPVNPRRPRVQGLTAYASLADVPEVPDVAIVAVGQDAVLDVVRQCGRLGVGAAVIMSSGFGETGTEGAQRQAGLLEQARESGVRLIGPNAQGIANFQNGAVLNFSTMFMEIAPQDGPVAIISQSGAASVMPYALLRERGIGVRYLAASGNDADATVCELAMVAAEDPDVRVILMYMESLADPRMLARVSRVANRRGAAVVVLKGGRSVRGARAAASHTGAMVNDDVLVDAFLQRHGIWRAHDVHGLINATELYLAMPPMPARHLVVMSHSGAVGVLCADAAADLGLALAELSAETVGALATVMPSFAAACNPIDMTASLMTQGGMYADTLRILGGEPLADMFLIGIPVAGPGYDVPGMARDTARFVAATGKPVVISSPQASVRAVFRAAGLPVFAHESDALSALDQWRRHAALQIQARKRDGLAAHADTDAGYDDAPHLPPRAAEGRFLDEARSLALLATGGIPAVPYRLAQNLTQALQAWQALGGDVVIKACSAQIPHKSEHGLVFLDVRTSEQVEHAWHACRDRVTDMGLPFEGAIVAQRVRGRWEFALGLRHDPLFGDVVMVGDGGKYVEALRDSVALLYPFDEDDVHAKLQTLRIAPLLGGVRGEAPMDVEVLARAAVALGRLAHSCAGQLASVDVNPLIVGSLAQGGWAVDAVVERKDISHG